MVRLAKLRLAQALRGAAAVTAWLTTNIDREAAATGTRAAMRDDAFLIRRFAVVDRRARIMI